MKTMQTQQRSKSKTFLHLPKLASRSNVPSSSTMNVRNNKIQSQTSSNNPEKGFEKSDKEVSAKAYIVYD